MPGFNDGVGEILLHQVVNMEESVTYQAIKAKGRAEGLLEGAVQEAKMVLLLQGRKRFGIPRKQITSALEAIEDLRQLEELAVKLLDAAGWDDLLVTPPQIHRNRKKKRES